MSHGLFEEKVKLDEESHRYFDGAGNEYISFSRIYDMICDPFDSENISRFVAKARGCSQDEVKQEWGSKTENGTRIDEAITLYSKLGIIKDENNDIIDLVRDVTAEYNRYRKNFSQVVLYNEKYRTAGTADKLFLFTYMKNSNFGISDIKCFENVYNQDGSIKYTSYETLFVRRGWLKEPFSHLPSTKLTKISFQLSAYAYYFEELTGKKCNELYIHLINPTTKMHQKVYVPYMRSDIRLLLEHTRPQVQELLNKSVVVNQEDEAF